MCKKVFSIGGTIRLHLRFVPVGAAPPAPLQDRPVKPPSKSLDTLDAIETTCHRLERQC